MLTIARRIELVHQFSKQADDLLVESPELSAVFLAMAGAVLGEQERTLAKVVYTCVMDVLKPEIEIKLMAANADQN